MTTSIKPLVLCLLTALIFSGSAVAQSWDNVQVNLFTHLEYYDNTEVDVEEPVSLGESALFVTARLPNKWSFLAEGTYRPKKYRDDVLTLERYRLRYELNADHWVSVGKMHTPINYWNDTYHHGRLFFPSINRPLSFNRFIPIHELGVRLGGQRLGGSDFGYDFVVGTGQSEGDDFFEEGIRSYAGNISWSPSNNARVMVSYYRDTILDHQGNPFHSHGDEYRSDMGAHTGTDAVGGFVSDDSGDDIPYELFSFSAFWQTGDWKSLTELSLNRTDRGEFNEAAYQYLGYQFHPDWTAYLLFDMVNVSNAEIHFESGRESRYGIGFEYTLGIGASIKTEFRRRDDHRGDMDMYSNELQVQLSLGF